MAKLYELGNELVPPNPRIWLQTDAYFKDSEISSVMEGIQTLKKRWSNYIELKGDYVEK